jgi:Xaa-Pro aminopeptidase
MATSSARGLTAGKTQPVPLDFVDIVFSEQEYAERRRRTREKMAEAKVDLLLVTLPEHFCYLHGLQLNWFKGNSSRRWAPLACTAIHVDHENFVHFDGPNELPMLSKTSVSKDNRYFRSRDADANLAFILTELEALGWLRGTAGLEKWSYIPNPLVSAMVEGSLLAKGLRVVDASSILRDLRLVKSPAEIACIEKAAEIADVGMKAVQETLRAGITELDLFGEVMHQMMRAGGEFPALIPTFNATAVIDGMQLPTGHSMATRRKIKAGELFKADLCGVFHRYHADVMRGFFVGDPPKKLQNDYARAGKLFEVVRLFKAGMTVGEANRLVKAFLQSVGLADEPGWALGYELGLSFPPDWIGEFYFTAFDDTGLDRVFQENMVTNYESFFNSSLVDMVVYGTEGSRVLSKTPLELIVVN